MKKFVLFLLPVILLASCQQYDNSIHGTTVTPGAWVPTYDSAGVAIGTHQVSDTTYLVSPTWAQAWKWSGERGNRWLFWLGIAIIAIGITLFIVLQQKGGASIGTVLIPIVAILVGGAITGGSLEWEKWNMDQEISKSAYDQYMKNPGNLGPFWDTNIK